jgi:isochorismate pyruvate lyase
MIDPEQCQSMAEVRAGVDALDHELVVLLAKRFRFMDAAARIKQRRHQVRDEDRKAAVLEYVRSEAAAAGAPADILASVFENLVDASIAYELDQFDARFENGRSQEAHTA